jgi:hypothetical protein
LLAGELASPWHYLLLSGGLLSMGLCLLPLMASVMSLEGEVGFQLWSHRSQGNRHRGRSVLHLWCGCDGSRHNPYVAYLERGAAVRNSSVESSVMAHRGDETPLRVEPMKAVPELSLLGERLRLPK